MGDQIFGLKLVVFYDFVFECGGIDKFEGLRITDVKNRFLKPLNYSFLDLLKARKSTEYGIATVVVTYTPNDIFLDFLKALKNNFKDSPNAYIWCDFFCLSQDNIDLHESAKLIISVMSSGKKSVVVITSWKSLQLLQNIWCLYELYSIRLLKSKLDIATSSEEKQYFLTYCKSQEDANKLLISIQLMLKNTIYHAEESWDLIASLLDPSTDGLVGFIKAVYDLFEEYILLQNKSLTPITSCTTINGDSINSSSINSDSTDSISKPITIHTHVLSKNNEKISSTQKLRDPINEEERYIYDGREGGHASLITPVPAVENNLLEEENELLKISRRFTEDDIFFEELELSEEIVPDRNTFELESSKVGNETDLLPIYREEDEVYDAEDVVEEKEEVEVRAQNTKLDVEHVIPSIPSKYKTENDTNNTPIQLLEKEEKLEVVEKQENNNNDNDTFEIRRKEANVMSALGVLYKSQGLLTQAEPLLQESLAIYWEILGHQHKDTLEAMYQLGNFYQLAGKLDDAEILFEKCLSLRTEFLTEKHPDTLYVMHSLGTLYASKGYMMKNAFVLYIDEAIRLYQKCLEFRIDILGESHRDTLQSYNNLALLYKNIGKYILSEVLYEKCIILSRETLGESHPNTITSINNLAVLFATQGDFIRARPLYEECLRLHTYGGAPPTSSTPSSPKRKFNSPRGKSTSTTAASSIQRLNSSFDPSFSTTRNIDISSPSYAASTEASRAAIVSKPDTAFASTSPQRSQSAPKTRASVTSASALPMTRERSVRPSSANNLLSRQNVFTAASAGKVDHTSNRMAPPTNPATSRSNSVSRANSRSSSTTPASSRPSSANKTASTTTSATRKSYTSTTPLRYSQIALASTSTTKSEERTSTSPSRKAIGDSHSHNNQGKITSSNGLQSLPVAINSSLGTNARSTRSSTAAVSTAKRPSTGRQLANCTTANTAITESSSSSSPNSRTIKQSVAPLGKTSQKQSASVPVKDSSCTVMKTISPIKCMNDSIVKSHDTSKGKTTMTSSITRVNNNNNIIINKKKSPIQTSVSTVPITTSDTVMVIPIQFSPPAYTGDTKDKEDSDHEEEDYPPTTFTGQQLTPPTPPRHLNASRALKRASVKPTVPLEEDIEVPHKGDSSGTSSITNDSIHVQANNKVKDEDEKVKDEEVKDEEGETENIKSNYSPDSSSSNNSNTAFKDRLLARLYKSSVETSSHFITSTTSDTAGIVVVSGLMEEADSNDKEANTKSIVEVENDVTVVTDCTATSIACVTPDKCPVVEAVEGTTLTKAYNKKNFAESLTASPKRSVQELLAACVSATLVDNNNAIDIDNKSSEEFKSLDTKTDLFLSTTGNVEKVILDTYTGQGISTTTMSSINNNAHDNCSVTESRIFTPSDVTVLNEMYDNDNDIDEVVHALVGAMVTTIDTRMTMLTGSVTEATTSSIISNLPPQIHSKSRNDHVEDIVLVNSQEILEVPINDYIQTKDISEVEGLERQQKSVLSLPIIHCNNSPNKIDQIIDVDNIKSSDILLIESQSKVLKAKELLQQFQAMSKARSNCR